MSKLKSLQNKRHYKGAVPQASKRQRYLDTGKVRHLILPTRNIRPIKDVYNRGYDVEIGEVLLVRFKGKGSTDLGIRPCVVLHSGGTDNIIEVVALTKQKPKYAHHIVLLDRVLRKPSTALCDNVHTVDKTQVIQSWGKLERDNFIRILNTRKKMIEESYLQY